MDIVGNTANVFLESDQVSLAIGRSGHNIKLASKLTGYQIEVYRVNAVVEDDVDLEEFLDEIDEWIIQEFKRVGLDTAKDVLRTSVADLLTRTELEEETIAQIHRVLRKEFEEE
jgi:N utilization substance protein A